MALTINVELVPGTLRQLYSTRGKVDQLQREQQRRQEMDFVVIGKSFERTVTPDPLTVVLECLVQN